MGTCIETAVTASRRLLPRGALHLSDTAATACLARGRHRPDELDLLINTGLYKNGNAAEPALASIIQRDIGANAQLRCYRHGTFSFDLVDGGCGVVQAAQLADGFVGSGRARLAMIVAADADPSPTTSRGFPFEAAGGAMLVAYDEREGGFERFRVRTFPAHASLFESHLRWQPHAGLLHRGHNVIEVVEAPEFADRCVDDAEGVVRELLADAALTTSDVDLVIASQYPRSFPRALALRLGIAQARVPDLERALHTAGPIAALEAAIRSGQYARARHILFVTVGAGITVATALYRGTH